MPIACLKRTIISISGQTAKDFLNGLITNSLEAKISFAALLTPQGKIIADFFVTHSHEGVIIDTAEKFGMDLIKRLKLYKLRSKIDIIDVSQTYNVYALWDGEGEEGDMDPRHPRLGRRLVTTEHLEATASIEDYTDYCLKLGVPDSDIIFDSAALFPADANMDLLRGVDYHKGCFIGQEVVSRMHRKGGKKKRICLLKAENCFKDDGSGLRQQGVKVGQVLYAKDRLGLGLMRVDKLDFDLPIQTESGQDLSVYAPDVNDT